MNNQVITDNDKTKEALIAELQTLRQEVARLKEGQSPEADGFDLNALIAERTQALQAANDELITEIVERKQAENNLDQAKAQLITLLNAVPGIVSWINHDLTYLGVNKHLAEMFGLAPEEFLGKDIGFLRTGSEFRNFIENFFQTELKDDSTEIFAHIDGKIRNYILVAHKFGQGESAFVVGIDNTERKQAETKLRRANDQLEAVLEAVPGMVSWISSDLHYLGVNRHLAHKFDLTPQDFVGRHIGFLNSSLEFQDFVEKFFASPHQEAFEEISSFTNDRVYTFLLVAQKYNQSKSAFIVGIDISDRKQAEAKYKNIFENAVEGIFQATIHGKFLTANPGMAKIFSYDSPEELIHDFNHNQHQIYADPEVKQQFLDLLIKYHRVERFEAQVLQKNGKAIWILISAHGLKNNQGQVISFDGIIEDITEQREAKESLQRMNEELELRVERRTAELSQANAQLQKEIKVRERIEDALRNSEAELRVLFEAMTDVITVFDAEGRYVKIVNTNSEVLYNPPADRLSKRVHDVLPKEQADLFVEKIQEVLRTQRTVSVEYSVPVDHGSDEIWFAASVSPMPNRSVIWVARNITERRRMVNAIQKAEEKYRTIFENTAEGIFQVSYDGAIISANPALVAMYGYQSEGELINALTDINIQLYVDRDRRQAMLEVLHQAGSLSHCESQVRCKDGTVIWISENVRTVYDNHGQILYYEGTVDEITQRKQVEASLRIEQEKSERLLLNILPQSIADRLKSEETQIADRFDEVTILFADLVNFTEVSAQTSPKKLVDLLNQIFSSFDHLADKHGLEKIKTIGDAYMVVGGLPNPKPDHAEAIAHMALDMQRKISKFQRGQDQTFQLRIGIHTGPVVAGVIGIKKFSYDLWGDAVNVASRMESHGLPGKIQVTQAAYGYLSDRFELEARGIIEVKGKGSMKTYWLTQVKGS